MTRQAFCLLLSLLFLNRLTSRSRWIPLRLGARYCHRLVFHGTSTICQSAWPCIGLVLSLCRRSARCPQPSLPTSEQLIESYLPVPDQLPLAGKTLGSRGPPPPWPLAVFSSSSAQWCSVNTTPSRGSARQLRRFTGVWRLEPARERFRRWMKTRVARPPYQVECSC